MAQGDAAAVYAAWRDASIGQGGFCGGTAFSAAAKAIHAIADTRDWDDGNYATRRRIDQGGRCGGWCGLGARSCGSCWPMIGPATGTRIFLACGHTDMRRGMDGLAALVQQAFGQDPFCGAVYLFRGRRGRLIKCVCPGLSVILWGLSVILCAGSVSFIRPRTYRRIGWRIGFWPRTTRAAVASMLRPLD